MSQTMQITKKNNENMLQKECHKHYKIYIINDFILHYVYV